MKECFPQARSPHYASLHCGSAFGKILSQEQVTAEKQLRYVVREDGFEGKIFRLEFVPPAGGMSVGGKYGG